MSIDNVFYQRRFSDNQRKEISRCGLWPMIVGVHFATGGKLRMTWATAALNEVTMADEWGYPILNLIENSDGYHVKEYTVPSLHRMAGQTAHAVSKNSTYLLNRIRGKGKAPTRKKSISTKINEAIAGGGPFLIADAVEDVVTNFGATRFERKSAEDFKLNSVAQAWALQIAYGKKVLAEVPNEIRLMLDRSFEFHNDSGAKLREFRAAATEMFACKKWVVNYIKGYGVIVGQIDTTPAVERAEHTAKTGYTSRFTKEHLVVTVPFELYKPDEFPAEWRDHLMSKLVILKAHRSPATQVLDKEGLFATINPHSVALYDDIGAAYMNSRGSNFVMVDA